MAALRSPLSSCVPAGASGAEFAARQAQRLERASALSAQCSKWTMALFALHLAAFWLWASLPPQRPALILGGGLSLCALWFIWELGRASRWWLKLLELHSLQAKLDALETLRQTAADLVKKHPQRAQKTAPSRHPKGVKKEI